MLLPCPGASEVCKLIAELSLAYAGDVSECLWLRATYVCISDGWTAGMIPKRNPSVGLLCLLKDSDPLQQREIRLMALVERGGKKSSATGRGG